MPSRGKCPRMFFPTTQQIDPIRFRTATVKFATCIVSSRGLFSYQSMAVVINLP